MRRLLTLLILSFGVQTGCAATFASVMQKLGCHKLSFLGQILCKRFIDQLLISRHRPPPLPPKPLFLLDGLLRTGPLPPKSTASSGKEIEKRECLDKANSFWNFNGKILEEAESDREGRNLRGALKALKEKFRATKMSLMSRLESLKPNDYHQRIVITQEITHVNCIIAKIDKRLEMQQSIIQSDPNNKDVNLESWVFKQNRGQSLKLRKRLKKLHELSEHLLLLKVRTEREVRNLLLEKLDAEITTLHQLLHDQASANPKISAGHVQEALTSFELAPIYEFLLRNQPVDMMLA